MSLPTCYDFTNFNKYPGDDSPTTDAQMQDYMQNQNTLMQALSKRLWQPETIYEAGQVVYSDSMPVGIVAVCTIGGATSDAEPAWPALGNTVVDNYCTWIMRSAYGYGLATDEDITNADAGSTVEETALLSMGVFNALKQALKAATSSTTTKAYLTGNTATDGQGTRIIDPNIYINTVAGQLVAAIFKGSLDGTAAKATADANGNNIASTYAPKASPALTGIPTAPTAASTTSNTQIATTAFVKAVATAANCGGVTAYSLGTNGYIKFSCGLILQWGYKALTAHNLSVPLNVSMSNANYIVQLTSTFTTTTDGYGALACSSRSTGSFVVTKDFNETNKYGFWIVLGQ